MAATIDSQRVRDWLFDRALPLWCGPGRDTVHGGFAEELGLDGGIVATGRKRFRVQARQAFSYCLAGTLGWSGGWPGTWREAADAGAAFMTQHCWHPDGGWVMATAADGTHHDTTRYAYDHAFAILAFGALEAADGGSDAAEWVDRSLAFLDDRLADTADRGYWSGYRDSIPDKLPRRQNPHMHLLEALLLVYETRQDGAILARAAAVIGLFRDTFFDPESNTLGEFFTDDWQPVAGDDGQWVEPGHHFEWVWLLHRYSRLSGDDMSEEAGRLYAFARQHGIDPKDGLAFDGVRRDGSVANDNKRLWVQTEAIKALVARAELAGDDGADEALGPLVGQVFATYLDGHNGAWQDHVRRDGTGFAKTAPASTFYHLILAFAEVLRVFEK